MYLSFFLIEVGIIGVGLMVLLLFLKLFFDFDFFYCLVPGIISAWCFQLGCLIIPGCLFQWLEDYYSKKNNEQNK